MKVSLIIFLSLALCSCASCSRMPGQEPDHPEEPETPSENSDTPGQTPQLRIDNPFAPHTGDDAMLRQNAYLDEAVWDATAHTLRLLGSLPTPCNQLRITTAPKGDSLIINVYSVYPPDQICSQVLEPFEATLTINSIPVGIHTIIINEQTIKI